MNKTKQAPYFYSARDGGLATESASVNSTACLPTLGAHTRNKAGSSDRAVLIAAERPFHRERRLEPRISIPPGTAASINTGIPHRPTDYARTG